MELRDHKLRLHALLSPSGAYRWMNCTPAPRLEENFEEQESDFAKEGTLAHEICEEKLKYRLQISDGVEATMSEAYKNNELYSEEMECFTDEYVNIVWDSYLETRITDETTKLDVEMTFELEPYIPEGFGSADAVITSKKHIHVFDFKYGKGVEVSAIDNPQMKIYALGAYLRTHSVENVEMTIIQPRIYNISHYKMKFEDLLDWAKNSLSALAKQAFKGIGEQKAGAWCKFCKAKGRCVALQQMSLEQRKEPGLMSDKELGEALERIELLRSWADAVEVEAQQTLQDGGDVPGWKLVAGRQRRKITDELHVRIVLEGNGFNAEQITSTKLKGIGELEKIVGKKQFKELTEGYVGLTESKPELARENEKRPALSKANIEFKDL